MRALARHALAVSTAFVVLAACTPLPPHPPAPDDPTAYPPSSYSLDASGATPCEVACAHLAAFHCPEAQPTKAGVTCPEICARGQRLEELPTACLSRAGSVAAVRACGVRCAD